MRGQTRAETHRVRVRLQQRLIAKLGQNRIQVGLVSQLFGRRVAVAAGLLAAFYRPFLFYDALVLKVTLSVFLLTLALFWFVRAQALQRRREWLFGGLALGLACLTRGNYLVLVPVLLFWLWIVDRGDRSRLLPATGLLMLGLVLVILPVTLRNYAVGGDFVLIRSRHRCSSTASSQPRDRSDASRPTNRVARA